MQTDQILTDDLTSTGETRARSDLGTELHNAPRMFFRRVVVDPSKTQAVVEMVEVKAAEARRRVMKANDRVVFRLTVEAIASELVDSDGWMWYTTRHGDYTGHRITFRHVEAAMNAMASADLIERIDGNSQGRVIPFDTSKKFYERRAPRVRATQKLRDMLDGIAFTSEWRKQAPKLMEPIELRTDSTWGAGGKLKGQKLALPATARVAELARDVASLNTFIGGFNIDGCDAPTWRRIFHLPKDVPLESYGFDLGGRLYAPYQAMPKDERDAITFDGQPSVEVDVRASHLTILLHWHGIDVDDDPETDPYLTEGPQTGWWRDAVKAYITAMCGKGSKPTRWPAQAAKDFSDRWGGPIMPLHHIADAVERAYPSLKTVNDPLLWARLQYAESEAMMYALGVLHGLGMPALPIHDALRVPTSVAGHAISAFRDGFFVTVGAVPYIRTK